MWPKWHWLGCRIWVVFQVGIVRCSICHCIESMVKSLVSQNVYSDRLPLRRTTLLYFINNFLLEVHFHYENTNRESLAYTHIPTCMCFSQQQIIASLYSRRWGVQDHVCAISVSVAEAHLRCAHSHSCIVSSQVKGWWRGSRISYILCEGGVRNQQQFYSPAEMTVMTSLSREDSTYKLYHAGIWHVQFGRNKLFMHKIVDKHQWWDWSLMKHKKRVTN